MAQMPIKFALKHYWLTTFWLSLSIDSKRFVFLFFFCTIRITTAQQSECVQRLCDEWQMVCELAVSMKIAKNRDRLHSSIRYLLHSANVWKKTHGNSLCYLADWRVFLLFTIRPPNFNYNSIVHALRCTICCRRAYNIPYFTNHTIWKS